VKLHDKIEWYVPEQHASDPVPAAAPAAE